METAAVGVPLRELGLVLLVALAVTYLATGVVRSVVVRSGRLTKVRARDVHSFPKPRLGGVAMYSGFLAAMLLAHQLPALTRGFKPITPEMDAVMVAGFVIVIVGALDDLYDLNALTKLGGQIIGAVIMSAMGLNWTLLYVPFGGGTTLVLDQIQSTVLTAFFVVAMMNAINFIDGLDGLAAGFGCIAGGALLVFAVVILHDQGGTVSAYPPAIMAAGLVGMCAGFLPHNFEPSRIFMGDSGAMLIGLFLAAASTSASGKINASLYGAADVVAATLPVVIVAAVFFVPVLDMLLAIIRRTLNGTGMMTADKMHIHHRLLALGHTHRRTVLVLYSWFVVLSFGAVSYTIFPPLWATVLCLVGLSGSLWVTFGRFQIGRDCPPAGAGGQRPVAAASAPGP